VIRRRAVAAGAAVAEAAHRARAALDRVDEVLDRAEQVVADIEANRKERRP
jgi:replicative DNA helicase